MKTSKRFPSLLVAAIPLATLVLAGPGCGKPEEKPGRLDAGKPVAVIVVYDESAKTARMLDLSPEKKITLRKDKDWAQWVSPSGLVYVKFTGDSPFDSPPKHENKVLKSGPPKKTGLFTYEARLVLFSDGTEHPIDPIIEVME